MAENIRDEIVARRRARIKQLGHAEGAEVPRRREVPLVPFLGENGLICEVKRRSPSKGDIAPGLDAAGQADLYLRAGARNLSVLTEPTGFGGSLDDLMKVKRHFPHAAVLRKDFLFDTEDIDVAWRAGADAVLLIAGMLEADRLDVLYRHARSLGMQALIEVHDGEDILKARRSSPGLVGINSRDLKTFRIDPMLPVTVKAGLDWPCRVVYESGIFHADQATFAIGAGFSGLLVGEGVVRDPALAGRILDAMTAARPAPFWPEIGRRLLAARVGGGKPLIKICGLTREEDARLAAGLGADILGFVFHPESPRAAGAKLLRQVRGIDAPKVAVVVNPEGAASLREEVLDLLQDGLLDAVQFHGDETPDDCFRLWPVGYKALRPKSPEETREADGHRSPRVLVDAAADVPGGSGRRVSPEILAAWTRPLWLAGGITPDNAPRIAEEFRPELMDIASGVEDDKIPGVKSDKKLRRLFGEIGKQ